MARSTARKRALNTLYEADEKSQDILSLLDERIAHPGAQTPLPDYAIEIVKGVAEHRRQIDMTWTNTPRVGRSAVWAWSIATFCVSPLGRFCSPMMCRTRSPSTRLWHWPRPCAMTIRPLSSMACCLRCAPPRTQHRHRSPWQKRPMRNRPIPLPPHPSRPMRAMFPIRPIRPVHPTSLLPRPLRFSDGRLVICCSASPFGRLFHGRTLVPPYILKSAPCRQPRQRGETLRPTACESALAVNLGTNTRKT